MDTLPEARKIRQMRSADHAESKDKLARFLCDWLGGPKLYQEKHGAIRILRVHSHLETGIAERDAWLLCMEKALQQQSMPAERSRN